LLDDVSYETCLHNADWAGYYLYMRWHQLPGHPQLRTLLNNVV
jgi:hypothetical protein